MIVSVLYCDPQGVYSTIPGLDLWDESRDARNYIGTGPVVAHPRSATPPMFAAELVCLAQFAVRVDPV